MKKRLMWLVLVYGLVMLLFMWLSPKKIEWKDYFQMDKKNPYGSYIVYNELGALFKDFNTREESLYTVLDDTLDNSPSNYIFISSNFYLSEKERDNLLELAAKGNNIFISANRFGDNLLDTLNIESTYTYTGFNQILDKSDLQVNLVTDPVKYFPFAKQNNFISLENLYDSLTHSTVLSTYNLENETIIDDSKHSILVAQSFGKGTFYIHTLPYAFTNYYMLHEDNHAYAAGIFSYLPDIRTIWDEYYKPVSRRSQPMLQVFLSTKAFKWAFILGVSLLFSYMIFRIKRTQRIIPIISPPENRSLEFTNTIGDLYFHTNDNHDLVLKMERHFKEFIKEKYFIHNYMGNEEDTKHLIAKSGKTLGLVSTINTLFKSLKTRHVEDSELIKLSQKLHHFYYGRA